MMATWKTGRSYPHHQGLWRLGRNQLHTGLYIEERLPVFGVRYITISDHVGTGRSESAGDGWAPKLPQPFGFE